jgi:pimeloyl-ACP methyl ester carboxylesterase
MTNVRKKSMRAIRENRIPGVDGVPIWYRAIGDGPALVCCNGVGVSTFFWRYLEDYFGDTHTVVVWDYRGHGKSGQPTNFDNWTMDINIQDLAAVMDDAGIKKAVLLGHSMGCQVVLEAWRHFPERIAALIPCLGAAGYPVKTFFDTELSEYVYKAAYSVCMNVPRFANAVTHWFARHKIAYHLARLIVVDPDLASWEDFKPYFAHMSVLDVRVFFAMAKAMAEHSAIDLLPTITAPTLLIGGDRDVFTPFHLTEAMHATIPGSELLRIPTGSHAALIEQPMLMNLRIDKFFRERVAAWAKPMPKSGPRRLRSEAARA